MVPYLTVKENLTYPLEIRGSNRRLANEAAIQAMRPIFEEQTERFLGQYPVELSGGELQRIALVQSMIHDPSVMFADEPTGSLDQKTRRQVMRLLVEWARTRSGEKMLIWITHHDSDPIDHGLGQRLFLYNGHITWQSYDASLATWT